MSAGVGVTRLSLLVGAILLSALASGTGSSANPLTPMIHYPAFIDHEPIEIGSDEDFTEENGVRSGSGTLGDPYRIESLVIVVDGITTAVRIHDTSAYFSVGNVKIQYDTQPLYHGYPSGMEFDDCSNGSVIDCVVNNVSFGLNLHGCSDFRLRYNSIQGLSADDSTGIFAASSNDISILDNEAKDCLYGVRIWSSTDGAVEANTISNAYIGIGLTDCRGFLIGSNTFYATTHYYSDDSWEDNTWLASKSITGSELGLVLLLGIVVPAETAMLLLVFLRLRRRPREG